MVDAIVLFFEHDFFKLLDAQQTTEQEEFRILMSVALNMNLEGRQGLWEIACSDNSWLTASAQQHGISGRRINYLQGYDIYKQETWERLKAERRRDRPRKLWFSLPCTKWCQWSHVNYNTPEKREVLESHRRRERRMLRWAADFILDTMDNDPNVDVYFEWTFPCSGWTQHPMVFLEHELRKRSIPWESCRIDGCNYGVRDRNNDLFLHKRWLIKTTDELFHKNFRAKVCPKNHRRTLIEGIETSRSAYYPRRMVEAIVRHWKRELVPLRHLKYLTTGSSEADHEVENWMRRQKLLHEPDALPAELVPDDDDPPEQPEEANPLAEISKKEQDQWLARLRHYHRAAGHPSNRSLQRLSKDAGLPAWKLHMAKNFVCETCQSLKLGGYSSGKVPPASTHSLYKAWQAVGVDASEWLAPNQKVKLRFLLFIDLATKLKSIYVVKQYDFLQMQGETATEVITGFSERWLVDKPKPEILVPDNSKTFKSREMHDFCSSIGIQLACPAEKESWAHGVVESAIKDLKMTASAIQIDQPHLNPRVSLMLACAALNSTEYTKGYSAFQWCYGEDYTLADEDLRTFREFENYEDHMSYESLVRARQDAETVARKTTSSHEQTQE